MLMQYFLLLLILTGGALLSVKAGKLTTAAGITGGLLSLFIFMGAGFAGIAMTGAFFLLATFATSFNKKAKEQQGLPVASTKRNAAQVFANAGVAALCGLLCFFYKENIFIFSIMTAASLSSATADTISSETGNVLGKKFYNILTFKKDTNGLDGVISLEGTLFGIAGSIVIAAVYCIGFGFHFQTFFIIIAAGTIGNFADSFLGASLERKRYLNNDAVNFLNTLIAALTAWLLLSFSNFQIH